MAELDALRLERNRFVKLAFCRADLLFELDEEMKVVFVAGASEALLGKTPEQLEGATFTDYVADSLVELFKALMQGNADQRIDDAPLSLKGIKGMELPTLVAGYRAPEFENHTFLAIKIITAVPENTSNAEPGKILNQEEFSQEAARQLEMLTAQGIEGQVTLVRIKKLKDLFKHIGASDKKALTTSICDALKKYSLGGNTAGQMNEDSFGFAHTNDVDTDQVNADIEDAAKPYLPEGENLESKSLTLDADNAGMTEGQVAKALIHSMSQFCTDGQKVSTGKLSDALDEMMSDTVETVKYIKHVTEEKDFDIAFMPICDLRVGRVHHFEALSRFKDQDKARNTFQIITMAENLGLIQDFDYAVFLKTVRFIEDYKARGTTIPPVAINMSGSSLLNQQFVGRVLQLLAGSPDLNKRLMFELTESAEVSQLDEANKIIQAFRQKGIKFCLDDFGAGAASFDYLNALEVDVVKFDGPVIKRACANKRGHDMLSNMATMCSSAGVHTVAEMVEDKNIANQVFYCGIDYGQGWYFGKPDFDPMSFADNFAGKEL
ncbi:EAL domain-containing protein [Terasakiella sp. A23]|uniref:sensor domain-containing phosphodiesterase n=1 Tax=Terasakiella sp. FCG-A23 TaxID=3080561 RepID=UPI002952B96A|nr:EAL domain-containing protein [Terasakiella sp. A23]MDV7340673.1 EAL domain-containing protein [Terasakiella sp. A23]